MRWITFFILLLLADALQQSHFASIPHPGNSAPWPSIEYLPMLAIFYALFAAEAYAPLCGLLCGIAYDLGNHGADLIGTTAVPLAITAWLVVRIRLSIFRDHAISQLLITLLAILLFAILCLPMRSVAKAPFEGHSIWTHFVTLAGDAIYTALVAPAFYWVFFRFAGLLGFSSHGPRTRHG